MKSLKSLFLLDPNIIFLNHGSFGACPRPVFEAYQRWQRQLELQPVKFLGRDVLAHLASARQELAAYLHVEAQDVVYFTNPTTAANAVIRSLALRPGDQVLSTNHSYGAISRTWQFVCQKHGVAYLEQPIDLPVTSPEALVRAVWKGVNGQTRVICIDHLTSPTALILPVAEICALARQAGILTIVDGAHAPGQIPVDLTAIGADVYFGACHKWMMAPKGSAFLYVRPEVQPLIEPLVVSWGYGGSEYDAGHPFINHHEWQGTRDVSAFLAVPAAIRFQDEFGWDEVRAACHRLALETRSQIGELTGLPPLCPDESRWIGQFFSAQLPDGVNPERLKAALYDQYQIEVPVFTWNGRPFIRVSFQGYNSPEDAGALVAALKKLL